MMSSIRSSPIKKSSDFSLYAATSKLTAGTALIDTSAVRNKNILSGFYFKLSFLAKKNAMPHALYKASMDTIKIDIKTIKDF